MVTCSVAVVNSLVAQKSDVGIKINLAAVEVGFVPAVALLPGQKTAVESVCFDSTLKKIIIHNLIYLEKNDPHIHPIRNYSSSHSKL